MSNKSGTGDNVIALPKGGGAQQGLGETFSPDLFTGTGNFSVPIAVPAGRNGFQPNLSLGYSTGNGNSPFGMGWGLSVPGIQRKTNKGIPTYNDTSDTFVLSGAEDLVLVEEIPNNDGSVTLRYQPRTEGLFAKILHHQYEDGRDYWEVKSKDGLTSFYGSETEAPQVSEPYTLSDPSDRDHIFAWKLSKTEDPLGNTILYHYQKVAMQNDEHDAVQLYLAQIEYMNYEDEGTKYLCSVQLNYEDRPDPFSEGRAGFEVRSTLRCTTIETFTHPKDADLPDGYTADPAGNSILVKRYDLVYQDELNAAPLNGASMLAELQASGYDANTDEWESMPPLHFGYTEFEPQSRDFFPLKGRNLPSAALSQPELEMADLDGNGLPDFVWLDGQSALYWKNLGNGAFARPRPMKQAPQLSLADPEVQLMDADGDGRIDLVVAKAGMNGYFPLNHNGQWDSQGMKRYKTAPSFSFADPEVKLLDLSGDGITDVLRGGSRFEQYYQLSKISDGHTERSRSVKAEGWGQLKVTHRSQLESFPNVNFSNPKVKLADMNGDGLQDIVYVQNGSIWYWPNLGHGKWGKRRIMKKLSSATEFLSSGGSAEVKTTNAFMFPQNWDPKQVILGDVVGNGTADLLYVENGTVHLWINQSGNKWSEKISIKGTPSVVNTDAIRLVDILGTGVAGLLYTYNAGEGGLSNQQHYFLDFTAGTKPYVMNSMNNNMGAITKVTYESSVKSWIRDNVKTGFEFSPNGESIEKPDFRPWKTTLPFPVQVVAKTEVIDEISKGKLVTEYQYSHGYWDGYEREFRGFARVEQKDTETFERYNDATDNRFLDVNLVHYSPPTKSVNWFHLGGINNPDPKDRQHFFELDLSTEYWANDPSILTRSAATQNLLASLEAHDRRDAYRAWRGSQLRTELYAADANGSFSSALAKIPFTVSENQYGIRLEIESGSFGSQNNVTSSEVEKDMEVHQKAVFFSFSEASRTTNWERGTEPKSSFSFTADFDAYGQAQKQISMAVPRGKNPLTGQTIVGAAAIHSGGYLCTYSTSDFIHKDESNTYICDRASEQKSFEISNDGTDSVFELRDKILADTATKTCIGHVLNYYDGNAYTGLSLGNIGSYGLPVKVEQFYTSVNDLDAAYATRPEIFATTAPPNLSSYPTEYDDQWNNDRAGFEYRTGASYEDGFYRIIEQRQYDFQAAISNYGLVTAMRDVFENEATVDFDDYGFLPLLVTNPMEMETAAEYDYRVFQANLVTDANDNQSAFAFSPLGLLKATAIMGKDGDDEGDTLADPGTTMVYDFHAFYTSGQPIWVKTIRRAFHINDAADTGETYTTIEYSDGFGRLLQSRVQAEDVLYTSSGLPADQTAQNANLVGQIKGSSDPDNVVVNGFKIYNNKGKVVEQYEPYFDSDYDYTTPQQVGQKIQLFYDALGRPVQTLNPDGTAQLNVYGIPDDTNLNLTQQNSGRITLNYTSTPWESYAFDANDLGGVTHPMESVTYMDHWNTPESSEIDALGRVIQTTQRLESDTIIMKYAYDIQGRLTQVTDPLDRINFEYKYPSVRSSNVSLSGVEAGGETDTPPEAEALKIDHVLDSGVKTQVFDARGAVIERIDNKATQICLTYNKIGQPYKIWALEEGGSRRLIERYYYGNDTKKSVNAFGRLTSQSDGTGLTRPTHYDFKGNMTRKVFQAIKDDELADAERYLLDWGNGDIYDEASFVSQWEFDALNRPTKIKLPKNVDNNWAEIIPAYNRAGALMKVSMYGSDYVEEIAYDAKGQRQFIAFGNGVMNRYAYDTQNFRLLRMKAEKYTVSETATERTYAYQSGTTRQDLAFEYDLNGNILKKKNRTPDCGIEGTTLGVDAIDHSYTYDAISRLLSATGRESTSHAESFRWADAPVAGSPNAESAQAYIRQYTYDKVGNIQTLQQTGENAFTRTFDYTDNRLDDISVSDVETTFDYDDNGNLTQSGESRFYEWNEKDQLTFFKIQAGEEPSVYAHYLYDAGGQRLKKIVWDQQGNKEVTVYIDGVFEYRLKQEDSEDKEQNIVHFMDDSTRIAQVRIGASFNDDIEDEIHYILDDHLGSSTARLNTSGGIIDRQEFYPFGDASLRTYSYKRYQYVGKEKDQESGLIYYGARYYAAWTCRFTSVDPLALKYSFQSPYAYADNNPIMKSDPTGMGTEEGGGGGGSGGGELQTHTTKKGDTYSGLSEQYGVSVENLRAWNGYEDTKIPIGVDLIVSDPFQKRGGGDTSDTISITGIKETPFKLTGAHPLPVTPPEWEIYRNPNTPKTPRPSPGIGVGGTLLRIVGTIGLVLLPTPTGMGDTNPYAGPIPDSFRDGDEDNDPDRVLYRTMRPNVLGSFPMLGESARTLGVRPGPGSNTDIPVTGGLVFPITGGMSVAPDTPMNLIDFRKPKDLGGKSNDPLWSIKVSELPVGLRFRQDSSSHGVIEPAAPMPYKLYKALLESTMSSWIKN